MRSAKSGPLRRPGTGRPRPDMMQDSLHSGGVSYVRSSCAVHGHDKFTVSCRSSRKSSGKFTVSFRVSGEKHLLRQRQYWHRGSEIAVFRQEVRRSPLKWSFQCSYSSHREPQTLYPRNQARRARRLISLTALGVTAGGVTTQLRWVSNTKLMASRVFVKPEERILPQFSSKRHSPSAGRENGGTNFTPGLGADPPR